MSIKLNGINCFYGAHQALFDITLDCPQGETLVLLGPSGAGKSSLLRVLNLLEMPRSGSLSIAGNQFDFTRAPSDKAIRELRQNVGMVFQHFELFPHMSIRDNLALAQIKVLGRDKAEAEERGLKLLDRVGLLKHSEKFPGQLSGGQQQRVAIARALAMDPICMLFDEPTSALDPEMINEVLDVMVELAHEGMTMMVVTHEMGFAKKVADHVIFMDAGEVIENLPSDEFFNKPHTERAQKFLSKILNH